MNSKKLSQRDFLKMSAAGCGTLLALGAGAAPESGDKRFRIGVFDSRAVAVAYGNSPVGHKSLAAIRADYDKAKEAKDDKRMKEIENQMQTRQRRQHEQGFSTGSVANLLEAVKAELPNVAKSHGVDAIVSKWELAFASPAVETVDVTDALVKVFNPSEQGLKWIRDLLKQKPVPMDELPGDLD